MVELGVYVPSFQRYEDTLRMYDHLEYCTYVVRESEYEHYKAAGIYHLISVPDHKIDNIHKVHDWIIKETPEEVICIVDDDGKFQYRNIETTDMAPEEASAEIERIAQVLVDLNLGFACTDANPAPFYYTQEFTFKGIPGGCKWINKAVFKAQIDPDTMYNFDVDLELQELLHNRVIIKPLYFIDVGGMDTNAGGSNTDKNSMKRKSGIEYTKIKWGRYFDYNYKSNKALIKVKR